MAVRGTMGEVIGVLRRMIGDKTPPLHFEDADIQRFADGNRRLLRYHPLEAVPLYLPGGLVRYEEFCLFAAGMLEGSPALFDSSYNSVTATSVDAENGLITVATRTNSTLYFSGAVFDLAGAAADGLEEWAAELSRAFDTDDGETSVKRSQMAKSMREQAGVYRAQQGATSVPMGRSDVQC